MKRRIPTTQILGVCLLLAALALGVWGQMRNVPQVEIPRARYSDETPLGGKGLALMMERLGYTTKKEDGVLQKVPADARVWLLANPDTGFSTREADDLLKWVEEGGTLLWGMGGLQINPFQLSMYSSNGPTNAGIDRLAKTLNIIPQESLLTGLNKSTDDLMPALTEISPTGPSVYWTGVSKAEGSGGGFTVKKPYLELAGTPVDCQLARVDYGKGRIFLLPDALLFTNYALSKPDNAVLVSNLIRVHESGGTIYFDERNHGDNLEKPVTPNLLYYLWRPPLRYALLQLLVAGCLLWALYGRRLGAPVPLPDGGPVTRASQFAAAMGALFRKVQRPRAVAHIIGDDFRRQLTRRLGLSISDSDEVIARRASEVTGYSYRVIDRLLLRAKTPDDDEARTLADVQEMETILRSLDKR